MGTLTPNRSLQVPAIGGDAGPEFAEEINASITATDLICGGLNVLNVGGAANVTLTTDQAQNMIQQFTGVLTGNITVFAPAAGAFYAVENATTGQFSLSFGCAGGGNAQVIPAGLSTWLWTDGSFTRLSNPPGWQEIATYSVSGAPAVTVLLPSPFRRFRITLTIGGITASAAMAMTLSNNGGASFFTASYVQTNIFNSVASPVPNGTVSSSAPSIGITPAMGTTEVVWDGIYEIYPGTVGGIPIVHGTGFGVSGATFLNLMFGATYNVVGAINAAQISVPSGTFSGSVIVEGLP